jgi:hypothetical protein
MGTDTLPAGFPVNQKHGLELIASSQKGIESRKLAKESHEWLPRLILEA